jgi:hypothetical protein
VSNAFPAREYCLSAAGIKHAGVKITGQCTSGQAIPHRGRAWYPTGAWYWAPLALVPLEGIAVRQAMRSMRHAGPCSWLNAAGLRESGHAGPLTALPCCPAALPLDCAPCRPVAPAPWLARTALAECSDAARSARLAPLPLPAEQAPGMILCLACRTGLDTEPGRA